MTTEEIAALADALDDTLAACGVPATVHRATRAHRVLTFELDTPPEHASRVLRLNDQLRAGLGWRLPIRIYHGGRLAVEVPLSNSAAPVRLDAMRGRGLSVQLGYDAAAAPVEVDFAQPGQSHGLIAGQTQSGKSVAVQTIIAQLAINNPADNLRLALVDLKADSNTLDPFVRLPHLVAPIARTPGDAAALLRHCIALPDDAPCMIVLEEVQNLDASGVAFLRVLATEGAHKGRHVIATTQYCRSDRIDTVVAAQCGVRMCGRVDSARLGTETLGLRNAGAEHLCGFGDFLLYAGGLHATRVQVARGGAGDWERLPVGEEATPLAINEPAPTTATRWYRRPRTSHGALDWIIENAEQVEGEWRLPGAHAIAKRFSCGFETAQRWQEEALAELNTVNGVNTLNSGQLLQFSWPVSA